MRASRQSIEAALEAQIKGIVMLKKKDGVIHAAEDEFVRQVSIAGDQCSRR